MGSNDYFNIGYVVKTHGLKGEVTIALHAGSPGLEEVKSLFVQHQNQFVPHFIQHFSPKGSKAFVKFEDINTPEQAGRLTGCGLFMPKKERPKLARGEFYGDEIIGFQVVDQEGQSVGIVKEANENGPNPHLLVLFETKEIMIPLNGPFIQSIIKIRKRITVDLPEGFLEI